MRCEPGAWIGLDALSRLVLLVTSPLYLGCGLYAVDYLNLRRDRGNRVIVPCLLVFLSTMTLAIVSRHLGVLRDWTPWIVAATPSALYLLLSLGAFAWLVRYR